jgi:hypothetical protein
MEGRSFIYLFFLCMDYLKWLSAAQSYIVKRELGVKMNGKDVERSSHGLVFAVSPAFAWTDL